MKETPEQKTARIAKEIEEERRARHAQMDQSFSTKKKIAKSEKREHKRAEWNRKKEKIAHFLQSDKFKNYIKLFIKFILLVLSIILVIIFWKIVAFWLFRFFKWIFLPLTTLGLFVRFTDNEYRHLSPEWKRFLVLAWCGLCVWIMEEIWLFKEVQGHLAQNRKRILPLCAIIITYSIVWYTNNKKNQ